MANPAALNNGAYSPGEEMRVPFALSALFHLALLLLAVFGMHLLPQKKLDVPPPIAISLVNPSDIARTTHVDTPREEKEPPEPQISKAPEPAKEAAQSTPPPPPPPEPPVEQKVETPPPPPPPPPPEKPPEKALPKLAPVPQAQTAFQQPAQLPPLQKPVKIVKPQPQPPKPNQQAKQIDQDFDSLLNNLTPVEKADQISKDKPVKSHPKAGSQGALADQLSADELALIHDRLKACWIIPSGALDSGVTVQIVARYNEDKTLKTAMVLGTSEQYNGDAIYRAVADSAVRALKNPACNPLPFPDGKYAGWEEITMNFDPKND